MAETGLELFGVALEKSRESAALHYFDRTITYADLDKTSDALATGLHNRGVNHGDRVVAYMQNTPQFIITLLASWKIGAVFVPVNPMNKVRELEHIYRDARPTAVVFEQSLFENLPKK